MIWFNAAQGSRLANGSAISYLTADNRIACDGKTLDGKAPEKRNKFSPVHQDVAVCCNPNATQVAALYVRGMWMRDRQGGLAATLYGPCTLVTRINGVELRIEERTNYPFEPEIEFVLSPDRPVEVPIRFRNPGWSRKTTVTCEGAKISREGDYWRVEKHWNSGDKIRLRFTPEIETIPLKNGEAALRYGALMFAEEIPSTKTRVKSYDLAQLEDSYYEPAGKVDINALRTARLKRSKLRAHMLDHPASAQYPFDTPMIELRSELVDGKSGTSRPVRLVPLGNTPALRRITFDIEES